MADNRAQAGSYAQAALQALVEHAQTTLTQAAHALENNSSVAAQVNGNAGVDEKVKALASAIDSTPSIEEMNLLKLLVQMVLLWFWEQTTLRTMRRTIH